ncbi:hypothetical protein BD311DRAFT_221556 [Dichomitus squalens]|uniref:Ubiquitin-like domain-containing protein n=1 Tax=Dichomitus squalens TaxID=114155 RepID=A0A4Q9M5M4_9APHY|nr:hypothetical protein BD311DRAFT_221556 [Dichomitus squalens]
MHAVGHCKQLAWAQSVREVPVGDLKKLIAAQTGTGPCKIQLRKCPSSSETDDE